MGKESTHARGRLLLAMLAGVVVVGCVIVPANLDPDAFDASKRYAIVTTACL